MENSRVELSCVSCMVRRASGRAYSNKIRWRLKELIWNNHLGFCQTIVLEWDSNKFFSFLLLGFFSFLRYFNFLSHIQGFIISYMPLKFDFKYCSLFDVRKTTLGYCSDNNTIQDIFVLHHSLGPFHIRSFSEVWTQIK